MGITDNELQQSLIQPCAVPDPPAEIDLRNCDIREILEGPPIEGITLVIGDPPWYYAQAPGHSANPQNHYEILTDLQIAEICEAAYHFMSDRGRLALWCTWPKLGQWWAAKQGIPNWSWRYVSGGSWHKVGGAAGTGFHWLGATELVELSVKGTGLVTEWTPLKNGHISERGAHSAKPVAWMIQWLERWTAPGDTVLDLFAGLGSVAVACLHTGRRYVGAEIDPDRFEAARLNIHRALNGLKNGPT